MKNFEKKEKHLVIGVDFGTDSVRTLIVDAIDGNEIASDVRFYPRWKEGNYCDPLKNQFRQHPLDYIESLAVSVKGALKAAPEGTAEKIRGLSIDTTGSTVCAVDNNGAPLSLTSGFEDDPNAMFVLWKDHTAIREAEDINHFAKHWGGEDYTRYCGGVYSSEWFWAKILHIVREDARIREAAYSWVEHCDWIPALLTGKTDPLAMKRSRTAAGHKAMWHASWDGLPSEAFLAGLDPLLGGIRERLYQESYTGDVPAGTLSGEWAERLGLGQDVIVGVGSFDAHFGAIGAQISEHVLVKVMGTSTCDMIVAKMPSSGERLVGGICGQVDGSIIPGMLGMEAGQSAFGDIYAWYRDLLAWPVENLLNDALNLSGAEKDALMEKTVDRILPQLSSAAAELPVDETSLIALDWMNGRRTPYANQALKGAIAGINLGTDAPRLFKALVEASAFGAKKIVDRFVEEGVEIRGVIGIGGISKKAPFVMQVMADILNMPIKIARSEQACALGSAMAAAAASGIYGSISSAQEAMGSGFERTYQPVSGNHKKYQTLYEKYTKLGEFVEKTLTGSAAITVTSRPDHKFMEIKQAACEANRKLPEKGLVIYSFGNVSVIDRKRSAFAIKPSGVGFDRLRPEDMVIVDLQNNVVEGKLSPSSDTKTHTVLYNHFKNIGAVVHTHSPYAVAWAQAITSIPVFGTTHADHLAHEIPCTEVMSDEMIKGNYEEATGHQIVNAFRNCSYEEIRMVLVACHGPFTWGRDAEEAVYNAVILEEVAKMALLTRQINQNAGPMKSTLIDKHYQRKHGKDAYYGQLGVREK